MATIAESYSVKRSAARAPISAHPAFPAIVALWFAALLGLGSLVLPGALLDKLVTVTGISSLVAAAAPPLGFTAHVAISLAGSIAGAVIGLLLARQVAKSQAPEPQARSFIASSERPCRPISAHDELGEEGLDSPGPAHTQQLQKRRSLAMSEESRRSEYLQTVPLPGQVYETHAELPTPVEEPVVVAIADNPTSPPGTEPLELGAFAEPGVEFEDEPFEGDTSMGLDSLRRRVQTPAATAMQDEPMTDRPTFHKDATFAGDADGRQEFQPFEQSPDIDDDDDALEANGPAVPKAFEPAAGGYDPLPFAAPSLRRKEPVAFDNDCEDEEASCADVPASQLSVVAVSDEPGESDDEHPLEELGLVQLAARLGDSIAKRRARRVSRQATASPPRAANIPLAGDRDFEAAEAEDAARAIADFFGPANAAGAIAPPTTPNVFDEEPGEPEAIASRQPAVPASMRSLTLDDYEEDEDALSASFSLPLGGTFAMSTEDFDEDDPEGAEYEDGDDDSEYSSLLAMKNPFVRPQEFVRVEEPEDQNEIIEPTVTFPSTVQSESAPPPEPQADADVGRPFDPPKKPSESVTRTAAPLTQRDPGDAERNLRAALETLQRMSGAA